MKTVLLTENEYNKVMSVLNESVKDLSSLIIKMNQHISSKDTTRPNLMSVHYNADRNRFEATDGYKMLIVDGDSFGVHSVQDVKDGLEGMKDDPMESEFGFVDDTKGGLCIFYLISKTKLRAFKNAFEKGDLYYPNVDVVIPLKHNVVNVKESEGKDYYPVKVQDGEHPFLDKGDWLLSYNFYFTKDDVIEMTKYMKWFGRYSFEDTMMWDPDKASSPLVSYQDNFTILRMPRHHH